MGWHPVAYCFSPVKKGKITTMAMLQKIYCGLSWTGSWVSLLGLRLVLAWEFWHAGIRKLNGENWFAQIIDDFPFPFNIVPVGISWFLTSWTEIIGALALVIGLATRFWVAGLIILDLVAWVSVHGDNGYNVCDNGYKLPLLYLVMLIPLLLNGPGKLSVDHLFVKTNRL